MKIVFLFLFIFTSCSFKSLIPSAYRTIGSEEDFEKLAEIESEAKILFSMMEPGNQGALSIHIPLKNPGVTKKKLKASYYKLADGMQIVRNEILLRQMDGVTLESINFLVNSYQRYVVLWKSMYTIKYFLFHDSSKNTDGHWRDLDSLGFIANRKFLLMQQTQIPGVEIKRLGGLKLSDKKFGEEGVGSTVALSNRAFMKGNQSKVINLSIIARMSTEGFDSQEFGITKISAEEKFGIENMLNYFSANPINIVTLLKLNVQRELNIATSSAFLSSDLDEAISCNALSDCQSSFWSLNSETLNILDNPYYQGLKGNSFYSRVWPYIIRESFYAASHFPFLHFSKHNKTKVIPLPLRNNPGYSSNSFLDLNGTQKKYVRELENYIYEIINYDGSEKPSIESDESVRSIRQAYVEIFKDVFHPFRWKDRSDMKKQVEDESYTAFDFEKKIIGEIHPSAYIAGEYVVLNAGFSNFQNLFSKGDGIPSVDKFSQYFAVKVYEIRKSHIENTLNSAVNKMISIDTLKNLSAQDLSLLESNLRRTVKSTIEAIDKDTYIDRLAEIIKSRVTSLFTDRSIQAKIFRKEKIQSSIDQINLNLIDDVYKTKEKLDSYLSTLSDQGISRTSDPGLFEEKSEINVRTVRSSSSYWLDNLNSDLYSSVGFFNPNEFLEFFVDQIGKRNDLTDSVMGNNFLRNTLSSLFDDVQTQYQRKYEEAEIVKDLKVSVSSQSEIDYLNYSRVNVRILKDSILYGMSKIKSKGYFEKNISRNLRKYYEKGDGLFTHYIYPVWSKTPDGFRILPPKMASQKIKCGDTEFNESFASSINDYINLQLKKEGVDPDGQYCDENACGNPFGDCLEQMTAIPGYQKIFSSEASWKSFLPANIIFNACIKNNCSDTSNPISRFIDPKITHWGMIPGMEANNLSENKIFRLEGYYPSWIGIDERADVYQSKPKKYKDNNYVSYLDFLEDYQRIEESDKYKCRNGDALDSGSASMRAEALNCKDSFNSCYEQEVSYEYEPECSNDPLNTIVNTESEGDFPNLPECAPVFEVDAYYKCRVKFTSCLDKVCGAASSSNSGDGYELRKNANKKRLMKIISRANKGVGLMSTGGGLSARDGSSVPDELSLYRLREILEMLGLVKIGENGEVKYLSQSEILTNVNSVESLISKRISSAVINESFLGTMIKAHIPSVARTNMHTGTETYSLAKIEGMRILDYIFEKRNKDFELPTRIGKDYSLSSDINEQVSVLFDLFSNYSRKELAVNSKESALYKAYTLPVNRGTWSGLKQSGQNFESFTLHSESMIGRIFHIAEGLGYDTSGIEKDEFYKKLYRKAYPIGAFISYDVTQGLIWVMVVVASIVLISFFINPAFLGVFSIIMGKVLGGVALSGVQVFYALNLGFLLMGGLAGHHFLMEKVPILDSQYGFLTAKSIVSSDLLKDKSFSNSIDIKTFDEYQKHYDAAIFEGLSWIGGSLLFDLPSAVKGLKEIIVPLRRISSYKKLMVAVGADESQATAFRVANTRPLESVRNPGNIIQIEQVFERSLARKVAEYLNATRTKVIDYFTSFPSLSEELKAYVPNVKLKQIVERRGELKATDVAGRTSVGGSAGKKLVMRDLLLDLNNRADRLILDKIYNSLALLNTSKAGAMVRNLKNYAFGVKKIMTEEADTLIRSYKALTDKSRMNLRDIVKNSKDAFLDRLSILRGDLRLDREVQEKLGTAYGLIQKLKANSKLIYGNGKTIDDQLLVFWDSFLKKAEGSLIDGRDNVVRLDVSEISDALSRVIDDISNVSNSYPQGLSNSQLLSQIEELVRLKSEVDSLHAYQEINEISFKRLNLDSELSDMRSSLQDLLRNGEDLSFDVHWNDWQASLMERGALGSHNESLVLGERMKFFEVINAAGPLKATKGGVLATSQKEISEIFGALADIPASSTEDALKLYIKIKKELYSPKQ
jgi:hypothetical protein